MSAPLGRPPKYTPEKALDYAALAAFSERFLTADEAERLRDGAVTTRDLKLVQQAKAASQKLERMTRSTARDNSFTFERASVGPYVPVACKVTVTGDKVKTEFEDEYFSHEGTVDRASVHAQALKHGAVANDLIKAIKGQLVLQTGVETALEEVRDHAVALGEQAKAQAKAGLDKANTKAAEALIGAATSARAKVQPLVAGAQAAIASSPALTKAVEVAKPYVASAVEAAKPVVASAVEAARPVVADAVEAAQEKLSSTVEQVRDGASDLYDRIKQSIKK